MVLDNGGMSPVWDCVRGGLAAGLADTKGVLCRATFVPENTVRRKWIVVLIMAVNLLTKTQFANFRIITLMLWKIAWSGNAFIFNGFLFRFIYFGINGLIIFFGGFQFCFVIYFIIC